MLRRQWMLLALLLTAPLSAAAGNVVIDWDEKAVSIVQPATGPLPLLAVRNIAILHAAIVRCGEFDRAAL